MIGGDSGGTKGGMWGMGEVCCRKWGRGGGGEAGGGGGGVVGDEGGKEGIGGRWDIGSGGGREVDNCISGHILLFTTYFREYSRRVK